MSLVQNSGDDTRKFFRGDFIVLVYGAVRYEAKGLRNTTYN